MTMRTTGHIRQRTPGSWELRYSLGTDPATGKRRISDHYCQRQSTGR